MIRAMAVLLLASSSIVADDSVGPWAIALDYGRTTETPERGFTEFDVYRLTLRKYWSRDLWAGEESRLSGYWEAAANYWDADDGELYAVSFSPVLAFYFGARGNRWQPYIEGGIGAAFLSDTSLAGREFSTSFQFENRLGIGLRGERIDFHVRYLHYSNADIEEPNNGMDSFVAGIAVRF